MEKIVKAWNVIGDVINLIAIPIFGYLYLTGNGHTSDLIFWGILALI